MVSAAGAVGRRELELLLPVSAQLLAALVDGKNLPRSVLLREQHAVALRGSRSYAQQMPHIVVTTGRNTLGAVGGLPTTTTCTSGLLHPNV